MSKAASGKDKSDYLEMIMIPPEKMTWLKMQTPLRCISDLDPLTLNIENIRNLGEEVKISEVNDFCEEDD